MSPSNPFPEGLQNPEEEEAVRARGDGRKTPRKQDPLNQQDWHMYELTEAEAPCAGTARVCTRWDPRAERTRHMSQSLTQKKSPNDNP